MTEYEKAMLDESKKQTAHLSSIKASAFIILAIAALALGASFAG